VILRLRARAVKAPVIILYAMNAEAVAHFYVRLSDSRLTICMTLEFYDRTSICMPQGLRKVYVTVTLYGYASLYLTSNIYLH
jgi:hypothetical protein